MEINMKSFAERLAATLFEMGLGGADENTSEKAREKFIVNLDDDSDAALARVVPYLAHQIAITTNDAGATKVLSLEPMEMLRFVSGKYAVRGVAVLG